LKKKTFLVLFTGRQVLVTKKGKKFNFCQGNLGEVKSVDRRRKNISKTGRGTTLQYVFDWEMERIKTSTLKKDKGRKEGRC